MDLIYTNTNGIDLGVLRSYSLDLSFGIDENENNFELVLGKADPVVEDGAFIYIEGTEYGGMIGSLRSNSASESRTHMGRTWHGVLNSKIIEPDSGADYLTVNGDANTVLGLLVDRLGLSGLFAAPTGPSGVTVKNYQFNRYVKGYDGIRAMLSSCGAKLKMRWAGKRVELYAEKVVDYTNRPVDGDEAALTVERYADKVNHLICLGGGELAEREVLHLYVDQFGRIGTTQVYTGVAEIVEVYDYSSAESSEALRSDGIKRLEELRNIDKVEVTAYEGSGLEYDIGDLIGGTDSSTGNTAKASVVQKIVKIDNGVVSIDYKTGSQYAGGGASGGGGGGGSGGGGSSSLPVATQNVLGGVMVGEGLLITTEGTLSVETTNDVQANNNLPITSAGVNATVGNINALLETI